MTGAPARRGPEAWQVLVNEHRYGLYFLGAGLSNFGNWCQTLAGVLLVYRLSGSALLVGVVSVCQFVWPILLGPWAGVVADRFDRRRVLYVTQLVGAVAAAVLGTLVMTGHATVGLALGVTAVLGVLQAFQATAQLAMVPLLVPPEQRDMGLSLSSSQFNLARVIGPVIAAGLILVGGLGLPFLFNAGTFVAYVGLLTVIRPRPQDRPVQAPRMRDTVAALGANRSLLPLFVIGLVVSGATDTVTTLGPVVSEALTGSDAWTGWLIAAVGAGATVSAIWLVPVLRRVRRRLPWTIGTQAVGMTLIAAAPVPWVALVGGVLAGAGFLLSNNRALTAIQTTIAPELLGRITAVWLMGFLGGRTLYSLVGGAVADAAGPRVAMGVVAATVVVTAVASLRLGARERRAAEPAPEPTPRS